MRGERISGQTPVRRGAGNVRIDRLGIVPLPQGEPIDAEFRDIVLPEPMSSEPVTDVPKARPSVLDRVLPWRRGGHDGGDSKNGHEGYDPAIDGPLVDKSRIRRSSAATNGTESAVRAEPPPASESPTRENESLLQRLAREQQEQSGAGSSENGSDATHSPRDALSRLTDEMEAEGRRQRDGSHGIGTSSSATADQNGASGEPDEFGSDNGRVTSGAAAGDLFGPSSPNSEIEANIVGDEDSVGPSLRDQAEEDRRAAENGARHDAQVELLRRFTAPQRRLTSTLQARANQLEQDASSEQGGNGLISGGDNGWEAVNRQTSPNGSGHDVTIPQAPADAPALNGTERAAVLEKLGLRGDSERLRQQFEDASDLGQPPSALLTDAAGYYTEALREQLAKLSEGDPRRAVIEQELADFATIAKPQEPAASNVQVQVSPNGASQVVKSKEATTAPAPDTRSPDALRQELTEMQQGPDETPSAFSARLTTWLQQHVPADDPAYVEIEREALDLVDKNAPASDSIKTKRDRELARLRHYRKQAEETSDWEKLEDLDRQTRELLLEDGTPEVARAEYEETEQDRVLRILDDYDSAVAHDLRDRIQKETGLSDTALDRILGGEKVLKEDVDEINALDDDLAAELGTLRARRQMFNQGKLSSHPILKDKDGNPLGRSPRLGVPVEDIFAYIDREINVFGDTPSDEDRRKIDELNDAMVTLKAYTRYYVARDTSGGIENKPLFDALVRAEMKHWEEDFTPRKGSSMRHEKDPLQRAQDAIRHREGLLVPQAPREKKPTPPKRSGSTVTPPDDTPGPGEPPKAPGPNGTEPPPGSPKPPRTPDDDVRVIDVPEPTKEPGDDDVPAPIAGAAGTLIGGHIGDIYDIDIFTFSGESPNGHGEPPAAPGKTTPRRRPTSPRPGIRRRPAPALAPDGTIGTGSVGGGDTTIINNADNNGPRPRHLLWAGLGGGGIALAGVAAGAIVARLFHGDHGPTDVSINVNLPQGPAPIERTIEGLAPSQAPIEGVGGFNGVPVTPPDVSGAISTPSLESVTGGVPSTPSAVDSYDPGVASVPPVEPQTPPSQGALHTPRHEGAVGASQAPDNSRTGSSVPASGEGATGSAETVESTIETGPETRTEAREVALDAEFVRITKPGNYASLEAEQDGIMTGNEFRDVVYSNPMNLGGFILNNYSQYETSWKAAQERGDMPNEPIPTPEQIVTWVDEGNLEKLQWWADHGQQVGDHYMVFDNKDNDGQPKDEYKEAADAAIGAVRAGDFDEYRKGIDTEREKKLNPSAEDEEDEESALSAT